MDKRPQRMCVACRTHDDKRKLVRIVRSPSGVVFLDSSGKANGRGAYLCLNRECIAKSKKNNALSRALKCDISPELYIQLENECNGNG